MLALALVAAASISTAGQTVSKTGHITIIAIMPETLTLSINAGSPAHLASAASATDNPEIAADVTTAWSLMRGRTQVATWATTTMNYLSTPVIVAASVPVGINPFTDGPVQKNSASGFTIRPSISSTQMTGTRLTDTNRRGSSTAALSDSIDKLSAQPAANTSLGTLKIQVQPVL